MLIPKWSAFPFSYWLMATWVSQPISPAKSNIPTQLSIWNSKVDSAFGPMKKADPSPTSCMPISPKSDPMKILPQPNILSFGILYAMREAPPKIPKVIPKEEVMIEGLIACMYMKIGEAESPKLATPKEYSKILEIGF